MPEELLVILGAEAALLVFVTAMTLYAKRERTARRAPRSFGSRQSAAIGSRIRRGFAAVGEEMGKDMDMDNDMRRRRQDRPIHSLAVARSDQKPTVKPLNQGAKPVRPHG